MIYRPKNVPAELDVLDSPLLSPTPIGSALLGNVPGSALAERIFNDPTAWKTDDIIQGGGIGGRGAPGELILDPMSWFVDEVERFRLNSAASSSSSLNSASTDDGGLLTPPEKSRLGVIPGMMKRDSQQSLMGLTARHNVRPISLASLFDARSEEDFVKDIQAQMQMKTSGEQAGFGTGKTPHTADVFSPMSDATNSTVVSPAPIYSASTTLSFLDLYLESPGSKSGALRKSLYAKSQPRQGLGLKVTGEGMEKPRPVSLLSPLVHPDMSVEPVKRGSSVPPLDQLPVPSPQPNVSASVLSPEPKPILPPGLHQNLEVGETKPEEQEGEASKKDRAQEKVEAIPQKTQRPRTMTPPGTRSLPQPMTQPPPYTRTATPPRPLPSSSSTPATSASSSSNHSTPTKVTPSKAATAAPPKSTATPPRSTSVTPSGTPVRRLPTIPLKSAAVNSSTPLSSALPSSLPTAAASCSTSNHALPSSLPTGVAPTPSTSTSLANSLLSPEPTPATSLFQQHHRPMSAMRSPLGGPIGPRSRVSASGARQEVRKVSPAGGRLNGSPGRTVGSGLRRPPVLQL